MPTPYIQKVAKETGRSVADVEKDWERAKSVVTKNYGTTDGDSHWALVNHVFSKMAHGKHEAVVESDGPGDLDWERIADLCGAELDDSDTDGREAKLCWPDGTEVEVYADGDELSIKLQTEIGRCQVPEYPESRELPERIIARAIAAALAGDDEDLDDDDVEEAKAKLGTGKRFASLEKKLAHRKGVKDPKALAAVIGRKRYGKKRMGQLAHHESKVSEEMMSGDIDTGMVDDTHMIVAGGQGYSARDIKLPMNGPKGTIDLSKHKLTPYKAPRALKLRRVGSGQHEGKLHHVYAAGAGEHLVFPDGLGKGLKKESVDESASPERAKAIDDQTMVLRMVDSERRRQEAVAKGLIPNEPRSVMHSIAEYYHSLATPMSVPAYAHPSFLGFDNWLATRYPAIYGALTACDEGHEVEKVEDVGGPAGAKRVRLSEGALEWLGEDGKWFGDVVEAPKAPAPRSRIAARVHALIGRVLGR